MVKPNVKGWLSVKIKETANQFKNPIKLAFFLLFSSIPPSA